MSLTELLDVVSGGEWSANARKMKAMLNEYSKKKTDSLLKEYSKKWTLNVPGFGSLKEGQKMLYIEIHNIRYIRMCIYHIH